MVCGIVFLSCLLDHFVNNVHKTEQHQQQRVLSLKLPWLQLSNGKFMSLRWRMILNFHLPEKHTTEWAKPLPFLHAALQVFRTTLYSREYQVKKSISSRLYSSSNPEGLFPGFILSISGLLQYSQYCIELGGGILRFLGQISLSLIFQLMYRQSIVTHCFLLLLHGIPLVTPCKETRIRILISFKQTDASQ